MADASPSVPLVAPLPQQLPVVASIAIVALVYLGTGLLGLQVAMPPGNATALWPPSGLGLLALLVGGRRLWPGIFLGAFITNVIMFPRGGGDVAVVLGPLLIASASTAEIVLATTLIERFAGGRDVLARLIHVPAFLGATAIAGVINASGGLFATAVIGGVAVDTGRFWLTWWLGDVVGMLVLAPLAFRGTVLPLARPLEWGFTLVVTVGVSELLFGRPFGVGGTTLPLAWMILPSIVWAAVRLDLRAVVVHALLIHVLASWGSSAGLGILADDGHLGLVILDGLLAVTMVTGLLLCAVRHAEAAAWRVLEDRVVERTAALAREHEQKVALQRALVESQKQEAIGRLAGGVAHDFNNLLTIVRAESEALSSSSDPGVQDGARTIVDATDRAATLTRQLLAVARTPLGATRAVDVRDAIDAMRRLLRPVLPDAVTLQMEPGTAPAVVRIDPGQLDQVLLNLALNARDAMVGQEQGELTIRLRRVAVAPALPEHRRPTGTGPFVVIDVQDTGPGIAADVVDRIFEPFFTTRPGHGHGLGLPTAAAIVAQAGGTLVVDSAPGRGATFSVWLPAMD
jgi:signal transduction histidine kinase